VHLEVGWEGKGEIAAIDILHSGPAQNGNNSGSHEFADCFQAPSLADPGPFKWTRIAPFLLSMDTL